QPDPGVPHLAMIDFYLRRSTTMEDAVCLIHAISTGPRPRVYRVVTRFRDVRPELRYRSLFQFRNGDQVTGLKPVVTIESVAGPFIPAAKRARLGHRGINNALMGLMINGSHRDHRRTTIPDHVREDVHLVGVAEIF